MSPPGAVGAPMPSLGRQLAAFAWLRWRQTVNSLGRGRRGALQRLAAVGELAGKVILFSMATVGSLALAVGAGFAGIALAGTGDARYFVILALRAGLAVFTLSLFLVPALQAMNQGSFGRTRLYLLPIAPRRLHALEVGAHLADPWLLMLVPAVGVLGLALAVKNVLAGLVALVAGALLILVLTLLSSVVSFGLELLLRDRRRAERVFLVIMLLVIVGALLPNLLQSRQGMQRAHRLLGSPSSSARPQPAAGVPPAARAPRHAAPAARSGKERAKLEAMARFPAWLQFLPSEAYARAVAVSSSGRVGSALASLLALALLVLAVFQLSYGLWRRLLASPPSASSRAGARSVGLPLRLPGLPESAAAVTWAQVRTYLRTLPGRLGLVTSPLVMLVMTLTFRGSAGRLQGVESLGVGTGAALALGAAVMANLTLQSLSLNLFAVDGPGFSLTVVSPLSRRDLVLGKAVAVGLLAFGLTILGSGAVMALEPAALPFWPGVLLVAVALSAVLSPLHCWISMFFPKMVDLGRLGRQARPNQLAGLVGLFATAVAIPLAVGPAVVVFAFTRSVLAATLVELAWTALALVVSRAVLGLAARTLASREEAIYLALVEGT